MTDICRNLGHARTTFYRRITPKAIDANAVKLRLLSVSGVMLRYPFSSAWGFGTPKLADQAVRNEQLDLVMIGRAYLENPNWPYHAAKELGKDSPAWILHPPYAHWLSRYKIPTKV